MVTTLEGKDRLIYKFSIRQSLYWSSFTAIIASQGMHFVSCNECMKHLSGWQHTSCFIITVIEKDDVGIWAKMMLLVEFQWGYPCRMGETRGHAEGVAQENIILSPSSPDWGAACLAFGLGLVQGWLFFLLFICQILNFSGIFAIGFARTRI